MLGHYLKSAGRHLADSPFTSAVNIFALALGFICFLMAFGIARYWQMSDSGFANAERTYVVTQEFGVRNQTTGQRPIVADPIAKYLSLDFPDIEVVARIGNKRQWTVRSQQRKASLLGARADADVLKIFNFEFIEGNPTTALNSSDKIILSESAARSLFGDKPALGQQVTFAGDFSPTVSGVIAIPKQPSHMSGSADSFGRFDFLYGWPDDLEQREWWVGISTAIYILLPEQNNAALLKSIRNQLDDFVQRRMPEDQAALAQTSLDLLPLSGLQARLIDLQIFESNSDRYSIAKVLGTLGLLVLIVACINYANLATAQAASRGKEVGMRKVLGAGRLEILFQYWLEAWLLTVLAATLAVISLWFVAPIFEARTAIDLRYGLFADATPWITIVGLVFAVAVAASIYPVFVLAQVRPVQALRSGSIKTGSKFATQFLVVLQFCVASSLLIMLVVINQQNRFLKETGVGEQDSQVVLLTDIDSLSLDYQDIRADLINEPSVQAVSVVDYLPWSDHENFMPLSRSADGSDNSGSMYFSRVGFDFFRVFETPVVAGRVFNRDRDEGDDRNIFDPEAPSSTVSIVIDTELSDQLGFTSPEEAVGKMLYLAAEAREGFGTNPQLEIIGVVESRPLVFTASGTTSNIYVLNKINGGYPLIKIDRANTAESIQKITDAVVARNPNALVRTQLFEEAFDNGFKTYGAVTQAFFYLSLIALLISVMGLVGMATFTATRRRSEIGIRKTLGSSTTEVVLLLLKDFSKPVLIGNLLGWPLAWFGVNIYLSTFLKQVPLTLAPWIMSLLLTLLIAWLAVGGQAWRAARIKPAQVLRYE